MIRWKRPRWAAVVSREPREVVILGRPIASVVGVKSRFYNQAGLQVSVEELALEHYASEGGGGWKGLHAEGGIWATLFGLIMWDVIMSPVQDVFRTPFQTAPLDLGTDAFYPARKQAIEDRLQAVAEGGAEHVIKVCWEQNLGRWCRGVSWDQYSLEELLEICRCVGSLGLSVVCRMLAEDYAGLRGGMPDLLLWNPLAGTTLLSEVKGPRDRLSDSQRSWMLALLDVDVECEVLRVQEPKLMIKQGRHVGSGASGNRKVATPSALVVKQEEAAVWETSPLGIQRDKILGRRDADSRVMKKVVGEFAQHGDLVNLEAVHLLSNAALHNNGSSERVMSTKFVEHVDLSGDMGEDPGLVANLQKITPSGTLDGPVRVRDYNILEGVARSVIKATPPASQTVSTQQASITTFFKKC
ncbi:hypothetical protein CEUSTIGMA_g12390.t1 [Chlamydomonas eustigma]|uniref:Fanconi-associated nuclease n=1 Tax=Chlamydomonas eustigma TaxID=1157962 RepID=A0A250XPU8_9CHLO|nr:hypothetical protein CEUSTIGMA_g12390.t1 [Chlamydomonas eustigma]|eukprot:GAX84969.1 hypothetical protein CEUSTIGMA_g12390.t1 [Chlamydomonas eustigma]